MVDCIELVDYYERNNHGNLRKKSNEIYEKFNEGISKLKKIGDEQGVKFMNSIQDGAIRYTENIIKISKIDERLIGKTWAAMEREELGSIRRISHNSLISKINCAKKYFNQNNIRGIHLPLADEVERRYAGEYAEYLTIGYFLNNEH